MTSPWEIGRCTLLTRRTEKLGFYRRQTSTYPVHRGGVWSGATQAQRITAIFQMFTAVHHHFGGKYAAAIDAYRLNTVRYLLGELDSSKQRVSKIAAELDLEKRREFIAKTNTEADIQTLQHYWTRISGDYNALESKYNGIVAKFRQLQLAARHLEEIDSVSGGG